MLVLERYKNMMSDPAYMEIFEDPQVLEIYSKIWGKIPEDFLISPHEDLEVKGKKKIKALNIKVEKKE